MHHSFYSLASGLMLSMLSLPTFAAQPFEGRWSENLAWCSPDHDGAIDERPIIITTKEIDIYVSWCRIDKVTKAGDRFRLQTMCQEEGETGPTSPETFTLNVTGDLMKITTRLASWNVQRCPASEE